MFRLIVLGRVFGRLEARRQRAAKRPSRSCLTRRLFLESLEERCLLSITPTDLGTLGGASYAYGINNSGEVVGASESGGLYSDHAFLYTSSNGMIDLDTLGGTESWARGINDSGHVAGFSQISGDATEHAFIYSGGNMKDLGPYEEDGQDWPWEATSINAADELVGGVPVFEEGWAFRYKDGSFIRLPQSFEAYSINDLDQVAGIDYNYVAGTYYSNAVIWDKNDQPQVLGPGAAYAINDNGQVVGSSTFSGSTQGHAFLYSNGTMLDLKSLGGDSTAYGINIQGQVVGSSYLADNSTEHAFLYSNGKMIDLNSLLPNDSGWVLSEARGINDIGQIVGWGMHDGATRAFLINLSSVTPTDLKWNQNKTDGGVDFDYKVNVPELTKNVPVAFYWADSDKFSTPNKTQVLAQGGPLPADFSDSSGDLIYTIPAGTKAQDNDHPVNLPGTLLVGAPAYATTLIAVIDPDNTLGDFDTTANVIAMPLQLSVEPVYQVYDPTNRKAGWTPNQLGNSPTATIGSAGCLLTSLVMQLNYAGIPTDPGNLNEELKHDGAFAANSGSLAASVGSEDAIFDAWLNNIIPLDSSLQWQDSKVTETQQLRDLITQYAAPVMVQVPGIGNDGNLEWDKTGIPMNHFVIVTGLAGNDDFTINDPGHRDRFNLSFYIDNTKASAWYDDRGYHFQARGYIMDPVDLSLLNVTSVTNDYRSGMTVTDPQGRTTGIDPTSGRNLVQIPNSFSFIDGPLENLDGSITDTTTVQYVDVYLPAAGTYGIKLGDAARQSFYLVSTYVTPDGKVQSQPAVTGQDLSAVPQFQLVVSPDHVLQPLQQVSPPPSPTSAAPPTAPGSSAGLPQSVWNQLVLDLYLLSTDITLEAQSTVMPQFTAWYALAAWQSSEEANLLLWQELNLFLDLDVGAGSQAEADASAIGSNPLYNTLPGYTLGISEGELFLINIRNSLFPANSGSGDTTYSERTDTDDD